MIGAKPADVPGERLTTLDRIVNLTSAKMHGITISQPGPSRDDGVIL
jgi:hypothetical protein